MYVFENVKAYIDGKITRTSIKFDESIRGFENNADCEVISLPDDAIVLPGFIDTHIHGAGGADAMDGTTKALSTISQTVAKEGTTSFVATTMTMGSAEIIAALESAREYIGCDVGGARLLGVHLEGPYISAKFKGAQKEEFIIDGTNDAYSKFKEAAGDTIKIVTIAPEIDGAMDMIENLADSGICVSIGHSAASYETVKKAIAAGAKYVTHVFNAQSPVHHRDIGVAGSALLEDSLGVELIADLIHVSAPAIKLLCKNKRKSDIVLITDAIRAKGLGDGESELGGQRVIVKGSEARLEDGTLAGSVLTMNNAIKNMVEAVGISLEDAVDMATINPAKKLKVDDRLGSIEIGKCADFAILDSAYNVLRTYKNGKEIYRA